jgi:hypothetical protein
MVVVLSSILLLAAIITTVVWIVLHKDGYSLEDPKKQFNFHPTLMIAGYITLSGFCNLTKKIHFRNVAFFNHNFSYNIFPFFSLKNHF